MIDPTQELSGASLNHFILGKSGGVFKTGTKVAADFDAIAISAEGPDFYILGQMGAFTGTGKRSPGTTMRQTLRRMPQDGTSSAKAATFTKTAKRSARTTRRWHWLPMADHFTS